MVDNTFTLDSSKWRPAPKSFRYSNLVGPYSTKNGKLYRHSSAGWRVYDDPHHVYRINSKAQVVRSRKEKK